MTGGGRVCARPVGHWEVEQQLFCVEKGHDLLTEKLVGCARCALPQRSADSSRPCEHLLRREPDERVVISLGKAPAEEVVGEVLSADLDGSGPDRLT
eukprot:scaffold48671_cov71-Phaeocystis_antarctica.AAC.3